MKRTDVMQEWLDNLSRDANGVSNTESKEKRLCLFCRKNVDEMEMSELDWREWEISAICPNCYPQEEE